MTLSEIYELLGQGKDKDDLVVYVNTRAVGTDDDVDLETWLEPLCDMIAEQNGIEHILLMPYNQGVNALSAVIRKAPALVGKIRVRAQGIIAREILPILESRAKITVIPDVY